MNEVADANVELAVVVAYGRIIPASLLERVPMVNLHFSLLPRWRGAAPVERALLAGDTETGVCLMKVEEGLDTGPVYAVRHLPLDDEIDLAHLREQLVEVGTALLVDSLAQGVAGLPEPRPQSGAPVTAEKITKDDLHLRWSDPAEHLHRVVRLGHAWTTFRGSRLRILSTSVEPEPEPKPKPEPGEPPGTLEGTVVHAGEGMLRLVRVQPESRSPMSAEEWARGVRPSVGERLGSD
jgi:methionyl-tRNA formyltransferase